MSEGQGRERESKGGPARSRFLTARWRDWQGAGRSASVRYWRVLGAHHGCGSVMERERRRAATRPFALSPDPRTNTRTRPRTASRKNASETQRCTHSRSRPCSGAQLLLRPTTAAATLTTARQGQGTRDRPRHSRRSRHTLVTLPRTKSVPSPLLVRLKLTPPRVEYSPRQVEIGRQLHVLPHAHRNRPIRLLLRRHKLPFQRLYRRVSPGPPSLFWCRS